jgi:hypothetical protein
VWEREYGVEEEERNLICDGRGFVEEEERKL